MDTREKNVPLHQQVKEKLYELINKKKPGDQIPTERDLCRTFNLSRTTVRQAIQEAVNEGMLHRVQGKGTFIAKPKIRQELFRISTFKETITARGMVPRIKILEERHLPANLQTARLLNVSASEEIVSLSMIGYADEEPIVLYYCYLPAKIGRPTVDEARKRERAGEAFSTFELYRDRCSVLSHVTNQTFEATLADDGVASLLRIKKGDPVFRVTSIIFDHDNQPVEFKQAFYRGDKFNFNISRLHPESGD